MRSDPTGNKCYLDCPEQYLDVKWLIDAIYLELKRVASWHLAGVRGGVTLDTTDLAHEALGRLLRQDMKLLRDRSHALAVASLMIRRVLSNHQRDRSVVKRGGGIRPIRLLWDPGAEGRIREVDLLAINEAIDRLESLDFRQAQIVQMRCFGGMTIDTISEYLSLSRRTVQLEWNHARLWLARELAE